MQPTSYEISCDICGGNNITWSEFEHMIWCFDCKKDTSGNGGIFDGPIPLQLAQLFGITFDRIDIKTGERLYMKELNDKLIWERADNQSLEPTGDDSALS